MKVKLFWLHTPLKKVQRNELGSLMLTLTALRNASMAQIFDLTVGSLFALWTMQGSGFDNRAEY